MSTAMFLTIIVATVAAGLGVPFSIMHPLFILFWVFAAIATYRVAKEIWLD